MLARRLLVSAGGGGSFTPPPRGAFEALLLACGTTPVDAVCIGDSITEGQQASNVGARWVEVLANHLGATYDAGHTTARYYPVLFGVSFTNPANPWTSAGLVRRDDWGLGRRAVAIEGTDTASITFSGTGFRLVWARHPTHGTFSYSVDAGAPVNVDASGAAGGGKMTTVSGLADTSHTLALAAVSGTSLIEGILETDGNETTGIRLWEAGHGGYKASDYLASSTWLDPIATIQPQLVTLMLGTNDYSAGVAKATFKSQMTTLIANIRAVITTPPSFLLMAAYQAHIPSITVPWSDYVDALSEIAVADGDITFFSHVPSFGGYIDPPGGGLIDADRVHASDSGNQLISDNIVAILDTL